MNYFYSVKAVFPKIKMFLQKIFKHFLLQGLKNESMVKCRTRFSLFVFPTIGKSHLENGRVKPR